MMNEGNAKTWIPDEGATRSSWNAPESGVPGMDALSRQAIAGYRDLFAKAQGDHPWLRLPDEEFLMRLNAAHRPARSLQVYPTEAGLLMFGYEHEIANVFPGYLLDYRREAKSGSVTKRIVSNDGTWSGCVFDFWNKVAPLLADAAEAAGKTRSADDLSAAAKEGLANALVHSDYAGRRHVVVVQHADRIEYANPGDLRVSAPIAFEGGIADPRNPQLMKMFALIGACRDEGNGLHLISRASQKAGMPEPVLWQQADPARTLLTIFVPQASAKEASRGISPTGSAERAIQAEAAPSTEPRASTIAIAMPEEPVASAQERIGLFASVGAPPSSAQPFNAEETTHHAAAPRGQLGEDEAAVAAAMARVSDPEAREVLELFRDKRRLKRADVEELLGVGSTKAKAIVSTLISDGAIDVEGGGRSTYYKLAH